jgi:hypothetical protein
MEQGFLTEEIDIVAMNRDIHNHPEMPHGFGQKLRV